MASLPIRWLAARAFCQATEVEARVAQALETAVPGGVTSRDRVEGQFGNPVILLARRAESAEPIRGIWDRWRDAGLVSLLSEELTSRLDADAILHFRIDKEAAYQGRLALAAGSDPIDVQVKLKAYPAKWEEIHRVARALLGGVG